jgi:hypothetical protein
MNGVPYYATKIELEELTSTGPSENQPHVGEQMRKFVETTLETDGNNQEVCKTVEDKYSRFWKKSLDDKCFTYEPFRSRPGIFSRHIQPVFISPFPSQPFSLSLDHSTICPSLCFVCLFPAFTPEFPSHFSLYRI